MLFRDKWKHKGMHHRITGYTWHRNITVTMLVHSRPVWMSRVETFMLTAFSNKHYEIPKIEENQATRTEDRSNNFFEGHLIN